MKPVEQQLIASTTVGPVLLVTTHEYSRDSQARPSREFKRTQKVIRDFNNSNFNSDQKVKTLPTSKIKPKKSSFRPATEYDYYDDGDSILGKSTSKVISCDGNESNVRD